jgi:hypothetical protein
MHSSNSSEIIGPITCRSRISQATLLRQILLIQMGYKGSGCPGEKEMTRDWSITKMKLWLAVLIASIAMQNASGQVFYVSRTEVFDNHNSNYLITHASVLLPPDRLLSEKNILAYVKEMKATGLYPHIDWKLVRTKDADTAVLRIYPRYAADYENLRVAEFVLRGFPSTNKEKFLAFLKKEGLPIGSKLIAFSYSEIVDKIQKAIQNSSNPDPFNGTGEQPWVVLRNIKGKGVRIIISPA